MQVYSKICHVISGMDDDGSGAAFQIERPEKLVLIVPHLHNL